VECSPMLPSPIGVDDVFEGTFQRGHGGFEFLPIACSIERKRSKISRCSRFRAHPAERPMRALPPPKERVRAV